MGPPFIEAVGGRHDPLMGLAVANYGSVALPGNAAIRPLRAQQRLDKTCSRYIYDNNLLTTTFLNG